MGGEKELRKNVHKIVQFGVNATNFVNVHALNRVGSSDEFTFK